MNYRLPEKGDLSILQAYLQEHFDNGEMNISASMGLASSEYTSWVENMQKNASAGNAAWGKSLLYLCFDEKRLVGLLSIRYELPEELSNQYGDIGYGVRPSERNKGYATCMLQHGLAVCKEKGMQQVMLGCYKDNLPSQKVILKNGGELMMEKENYRQGKTSRYYVIRL